jgi:hypothetical protein
MPNAIPRIEQVTKKDSPKTLVVTGKSPNFQYMRAT